jgi:hypothetical protein
MAAILPEEGRSPAVQEISSEEFADFLENCENAPAPTSNLKQLFARIKPPQSSKGPDCK